MDHGLEYLDDPEEIAFFQNKARGIYMKTFFATLALILVSRTYHILAR